MNDDFENYNDTSKNYDNTRGAAGVEIVLGCFAASDIPLSEQTILDAGCGTGNYIEQIQPKVKFVIGVDANEGMLYQSNLKFKDNPAVKLQQCFLPSLPFEDDSFDGIMSNQVIHHLNPDNDYQLLNDLIKEANRVLKSGGKFIIHTSSYVQLEESYWFYHLIPEAARINKEKRPDIDSIIERMEKSGFSNLKTMVPNSEVLQKSQHFNSSGPLDKNWRDGDSAWALTSEQELKSALETVSSIEVLKRTEVLIGKYEKRRKELGQSIFICGEK